MMKHDNDNSSRPLKVAIICNSDTMGGASMVTFRLMNALRSCGIDARMFVTMKLSNNEYVIPVASRSLRTRLLTECCMDVWFHNGFSRSKLFKVSPGTHGLNLSRNKFVREADLIVLSWINQGTLSLHGIRQLARLGKPIVWVMHDMWNMTGICHHALFCRRFDAECGACPFLKGKSPRDYSHRIWRRKQYLYDDVPMTFVAVSNWLARKAKESSLLRERDVRVIPNVFPIENFYIHPNTVIESLPINYDKKLIVMAAARVDDEIKGLDVAINALNYIFDNHPKIANECEFVLIGNIKDETKLESLRFPYVTTGRVNDFRFMRHIFSAASVVLSTSLFETLPSTLIEGIASGCMAVTFESGGQGDIVEHKVNGYIAEYMNPHSVAEGIVWAIENPADRYLQHESMRRRFSADVVLQKYLDLFEEVSGKPFKAAIKNK